MSRLTTMVLTYGDHSSGKPDVEFKAWKLFGVWWSRHGVFRTAGAFMTYVEKKVGWVPPKESVVNASVDYANGMRFETGYDSTRGLTHIVDEVIRAAESHNQNIRTKSNLEERDS